VGAIPAVDVQVIEGLPGSGKSFMSVRRLMRVILDDRRPVFTNLPIRWPVMRAYLRKLGGVECANLIHPMDEAHFRRFLARNELRVSMRDQYRDECLQRGEKFSAAAFERVFTEEHGPDILRYAKDTQPNWVSPFSVIIIDEVHKWFSMLDQQNVKAESKMLQRYLSMHRHHCQSLWCISQRPMQINIEIRRQTAQYWVVRQRGEDKVAWGIRLKHFGLNALAYVRYSSEQLENRAPDEDPIEDFTVFPWLPKYQITFRLYDSFSHVGSPRRMRQVLGEVRESAGLLPDGRTKDEAAKQTRAARFAIEDDDSMYGLFVRFLKLAAVCVIAIGSFSAGAMFGARKQPAAPVVVAQGPKENKPFPIAGAFDGLGPGFVTIGGITAKDGDSSDGAKLLRSSVDQRRCIWIFDDRVWLWEFGEGRPSDVGGVSEVTSALAGMAAGLGLGSRLAGPAATGSVVVESGTGDAGSQ
jgi:hypothetical protein